MEKELPQPQVELALGLLTTNRRTLQVLLEVNLRTQQGIEKLRASTTSVTPAFSMTVSSSSSTSSSKVKPYSKPEQPPPVTKYPKVQSRVFFFRDQALDLAGSRVCELQARWGVGRYVTHKVLYGVHGPTIHSGQQ